MFLIPQEEECVRVAPAPRDSGELRMALQWEIPLPRATPGQLPARVSRGAPLAAVLRLQCCPA